MVRISSLPDISRFVRREGRLNINNTIHLLVGEDVVEVSGCVISQSSQLLQDLAGQQREIYLDQFTGEVEGIQDVVEMMYGGEVGLREENVKTILKFGVVYQIQEMYNLCQEWIKENLFKVNLFEFIQFGLLIHTIGQDNRDILDICMGYIRDNVKDELIQISKGWSFERNVLFVKFLAQEEILQVTLPLITTWVKSDENVNMVLYEFDSKNITDSLFEYGEMAVGLLDKMGDVAVDQGLCKKLLKIQSSLAIRLTGKSRCVESSRKSLFALLSEDFRLFPLSKLLGIESDYSLNHAEFVDIFLVWIGSNESSQRDVNTIWNRVRQDELAYHFLCHVRSTIQDLTNLSIPEVSPILSIGYEYYGYECKYESVKLNAVSELNSVRVNS